MNVFALFVHMQPRVLAHGVRSDSSDMWFLNLSYLVYKQRSCDDFCNLGNQRTPRPLHLSGRVTSRGCKERTVRGSSQVFFFFFFAPYGWMSLPVPPCSRQDEDTHTKKKKRKKPKEMRRLATPRLNSTVSL